MQELWTQAFSMHTEEPSKKEAASCHTQKWEQAEGEKYAMCYPFALEVKLC